jgi:4-amino-4-deoxy-L-arabinose transferase-like glycosyltransferase
LSVVIGIDTAKIQNFVFDSIRNQLSKFKISHLLLLSFALHLFTIPFPSTAFVMDEVYTVGAARYTLLLEPAGLEHPPLVKMLIAISMKIFGDYWFAWRFPIVLAAMGSLYVFYLIAKRFVNERYALFATAMLSFDVIFFVHGTLAYLDMPTVLFGLVGIELYFAKRYNWSAVSFGISLLMKELGLLLLMPIPIYHLVKYLRVKQFKKKGKGKGNVKKFMTFLMILLLVAGGGLWLYEIVFRPTSNLVAQPVTVMHVVVVDQNGNPIGYHDNLIIYNSTKGYAITNPIQYAMFLVHLQTASGTSGFRQPLYFIGFKPVWSWIMPVGDSLVPVHYYGDSTVDWQVVITPFVEYFFIPILIVSLFNIARKKDERGVAVLLLSWMTIGYGPWMLVGIIAPRWSTYWDNHFLLYFMPAVALGIPYLWQTLIRNRGVRETVMVIQLALTIVFLLFFFPIPLFR